MRLGIILRRVCAGNHHLWYNPAMPATTYRRVRPIWLILAALALWAMVCWLAFCTERASSPTSLTHVL